MGRPYFSVVIDNYNYGRFIGQAVDSVLAQSFPPAEVEIVAVDDGSTDDSRRVLEGYGKKVRAVFQKNGGQAAAFAAGFAAARGQIVCLLDSDDFWLPEKLSEVARRLEDPAVGLVQHYQLEVDAEGRSLDNPLPSWPPVYRLEDSLEGRMHYAATSSLAFRRSVLDKILPVPADVFYLYDNYLIDHSLFHSTAANISLVLGCHRLHGANNWAQGYFNPKKMEGTLKELDAYMRYLEPKLRERGLALAPRTLALRDMEIRKRQILAAMHLGDQPRAWALRKGLARDFGRTRYGAFRAATCLLALISPALYLRLYGFYSSRGAFARWRDRLLPTPKA